MPKKTGLPRKTRQAKKRLKISHHKNSHGISNPSGFVFDLLKIPENQRNTLIEIHLASNEIPEKRIPFFILGTITQALNSNGSRTKLNTKQIQKQLRQQNFPVPKKELIELAYEKLKAIKTHKQKQ